MRRWLDQGRESWNKTWTWCDLQQWGHGHRRETGAKEGAPGVKIEGKMEKEGSERDPGDQGSGVDLV